VISQYATGAKATSPSSVLQLERTFLRPLPTVIIIPHFLFEKQNNKNKNKHKSGGGSSGGPGGCVEGGRKEEGK
jgi:hypothetical protein